MSLHLWSFYAIQIYDLSHFQLHTELFLTITPSTNVYLYMYIGMKFLSWECQVFFRDNTNILEDSWRCRSWDKWLKRVYFDQICMQWRSLEWPWQFLVPVLGYLLLNETLLPAHFIWRRKCQSFTHHLVHWFKCTYFGNCVKRNCYTHICQSNVRI